MYCVTVVARFSHITVDDNKFSITKCDVVNLYTVDYVWIDNIICEIKRERRHPSDGSSVGVRVSRACDIGWSIQRSCSVGKLSDTHTT